MNKCFFICKVLNEPIFKFFFMKDNISICYFNIRLYNDSIIQTFALNELADYVYQKIHTNQLIFIEGLLHINNSKNISIEIKNIKIL